MNRRCSCHRLALLVVLASAVGCTHQHDPVPPNYTVVGFRDVMDGFAVSGGHLLAHPGKPAVMFGTVTRPKGSAELAYVIVFKLPSAKGGSSFSSAGHARSLSQGGREARSVYSINGKRIEATNAYELNADRTAVTKETLTVGGKEVDPAAGRLFVLDLSGAAPDYQQKKIALPEQVPPLEKTEDVERYAEVLLKDLREKEPGLKEWSK